MGYIEETSGNVLGPESDDSSSENEITSQPKNESSRDEQTWLRSCETGLGYFRLTNLSSEKVLSSTSETSLLMKGKIRCTYN